MEFRSERFRKMLEKTPTRLKEEVYDFVEEQGYRIGEIESENDFLFHVLNEEGFTVADRETHEIFKNQLCILSEHITEENVEVVEDPALGYYLKLSASPE